MMIDLHLFRVMSSLAKETEIKSTVDNAKSRVVAYPFIEYPFNLVQIARLECSLLFKLYRDLKIDDGEVITVR